MIMKHFVTSKVLIFYTAANSLIPVIFCTTANNA